MSANNQIIVKQVGKKRYTIKHMDADGGGVIDDLGEETNLRKAIQKANKFCEDNEVEYGTRIMV